MTKQDFLKTVQAELNNAYAMPQVESIVKGVFAAAEKALAEDGEVPLGSLGKLKMVDTPERECRNPRTGENFTKPAGSKIKFTMSKYAKEFCVDNA